MEVRIRLQKPGKPSSKKYNWRIVAITKTRNRQGRHLEVLGHYDPTQEPAVVSINTEKLDKWVKQGAQMSDTVRSLVNKANKKK